MKRYKVESLVYYTKITLDKEHIVKSSTTDIQQKLDQYAADGWRLVSTNATDFGFAVYFYLYFEKEAEYDDHSLTRSFLSVPDHV